MVLTIHLVQHYKNLQTLQSVSTFTVVVFYLWAMAHRWATEHFGLKKSFLHDELFIPMSCFVLEITCFRPEKPFEFW